MQGNGWFYEWEFRSLEKSAVNLDSSSWEWEKNKTTNELFIQDYIPTDTVQWFEHVASSIDVFFRYSGCRVNAKGFYLLLYSITLRTLSPLTLEVVRKFNSNNIFYTVDSQNDYIEYRLQFIMNRLVLGTLMYGHRNLLLPK